MRQPALAKRFIVTEVLRSEYPGCGMRTYLDHNATTPPRPEVIDLMSHVLRDAWGNASSVHAVGQQAKAVLDIARSRVAALIGAEPTEVVLCGSGTESDNLAIRGAAEAQADTGRRHLITTALEHEAVRATMTALGRRGFRITTVPVDASGIVSVEAIREALSPDTALVSVMHANNEIGTLQPVAEIASLARAAGALMHTDAVQTAGRLPLDVRALGVDLLTLSAHKFYGPKGAGALYIRRGVRLAPTLTGGRQERGRRSGTEPVATYAGMGLAAELAQATLAEEPARLARLRDRLEHALLDALPETLRNGAESPRVPNTTNLSFAGVESESLLIGLDLEGVAVSSGSACSSGTLEPSHVLRAMGCSQARALGSVRFSLGASTTNAGIDHAIAAVTRVVTRLQTVSAGARR
jgi:cysteine desulfurase